VLFWLNEFGGSGKSIVLEKFEEEIKEIQSEETGDNRYFDIIKMPPTYGLIWR
jgi:hypothetical protein